jgi:myotubularin-related protein 9
MIERKVTVMGGILTLKCKDFRIITLEIRGQDDFNAVAETLESLSFFHNIDLMYPFFYQPVFELVLNGWEAFSVESEFQKIQSDEWRISYANKDFSVSVACCLLTSLIH